MDREIAIREKKQMKMGGLLNEKKLCKFSALVRVCIISNERCSGTEEEECYEKRKVRVKKVLRVKE